MRRSVKIRIAAAVLFLSLCFAARSAVVYLKQFTFDDDKALDKWSKMILNGQVDYLLMKYGSDGFVGAESKSACSALYYRIGFQLKDYPLLNWKWRVEKFPDMSKATTDMEKDDYAARVYVIFPFLSFSTSKFLEYVWAEDLPEGTVLDSPSGKNVKKIVARSGREKLGQWVSETHNVYEDYIKAFGAKPNMGVGAVAIMCDADGTKSSAMSSFDEISIEGL